MSQATPDLRGLLERVTTLANESTDIERTLRAAGEDVAATTGLTLLEVDLDPDGDGRDAPPWSFPVLCGGSVVARLSFRPEDRETEPSPELVDAMSALGRQLGLVVERDRIRAQLEATAAELERSNRELEQFAYVASHDLQEPLRKIVGFSELLEQRYAAELEQLEGDAGDYLRYVTEGARRMARLIEDLLRYSRVGRRRPALRPLDLDEVVATATDRLEVAITEADADVRVDGPLPAVMGDPDQLLDLLANLIGNACKYRGDEPLVVRISAAPEDDQRVAVTVTDTGIGIDPVHAERIFEIFQRLHPQSRYEGSGIGLAICRRIVEHHGGRIWVESRPGDGARFTFTLPTAPEHADA